MGSNKNFYIKRPIEGATQQLFVTDIVNEIKSQKRQLTDVFWINSFQHIFAFKIPLINDWLNQMLNPYMSQNEISQIPFSTFNASEKTWYIYRKEKENLFGPMPLAEALKMKKKKYIFDQDFCFSFRENAFFFARELPEIQISPKEKDQPFYFQRRSRRFNQLHQCSIKIVSKGQESNAELINFSENGAGIISSLEMQLDDLVEITITLADSALQSDKKNFQHKAMIKSVRKENGHYRYGLFLMDKAHSTLEQLKNENKAA